MGAKWNSMIIMVFVVTMVIAMENVNGETKAQCHEDCILGCATTGRIPITCLQNCYRRCPGKPRRTLVEAQK
ncbi:Plant thionin family protein [Arabidopsis thaliana]|uniref:Plant thionin family protein n=1 Tax=Arabidopsis thaliana TaxID=3702 RepID=A0A1P8ASR6_ARATH|nr:Plant thionin family protein [Arabidopsis thaliana]ANM59657.1 Plant thionin family protein [Arabidopsis thaliana]|eukprot:NP_001322000.1 Plant thionin family protein [Arabidopsis thaliana]